MGRVLSKLPCAPPPGDIVPGPAPRPACPRALEKLRREARCFSPTRSDCRQTVVLRTIRNPFAAVRGPGEASSHLPRPAPLLNEDALVAMHPACLVKTVAGRRSKTTFRYLESPTGAATEPTLPVVDQRRPSRLRSNLTGTVVSEGPISISPLWFLYVLAGLGFSPRVRRRGPEGDAARGLRAGGG